MIAAILFLPLLGFLINGVVIFLGFLGKGSIGSSSHSHGSGETKSKPGHGDNHAHSEHENAALVPGIIASGAVFLSFCASLITFFHLNSLDEKSRFIETVLFDWISIDTFHLPFVLRVDPLNSLMTLIVTGVGFLIHIYSIGYMAHDATPRKFFAYLNLFCFAMLALILGGNLPILFLGWEGVGLCSYLLIGYWFEDPAKAAAGMKAFIVNRIGDLGFLAGIFFLFRYFNTMDFVGLREALASHQGELNIQLLTAATLCLFVGAMGKSAQIPLYVWLPDAMAGPTPVSALIHAATMVTAGVYMICRLNFIFSLCPITLQVISGVGGLTALFAATIAITQRDIKKVLAYSTVSQLGYMFMAVGVGAYTAGVFHLMTHAFFKALLFLGSGSVIHGMHEEQDIFKMGGLKDHMPKTFATFAIGTVAIAGIPPLAGFFSKDEILWNVFSSHQGLAGPLLWLVGAVTALLTAFYMTRLLCVTFLGKPRFDIRKIHVHESPHTMIVPLVVLAGLSIVGGFFGLPHYSWLEHWLAPVFEAHHAAEVIGGSGSESSLEWVLMGVSTLIALTGVGAGFFLYVKNYEMADKLRAAMSIPHKILFNKYYIDEIYEAVLINPIKKISEWCWKYIDILLVDGAVLGVAKISQITGEVARLVQTGALQVYAAFMLAGFGILVIYLVFGLRG